MKRMYKWLTSEEYLAYMDKSNNTNAQEQKVTSYGTEVI